MRSMGAVIVLATAPDTPPRRKSTRKFESLPIPSDERNKEMINKELDEEE